MKFNTEDNIRIKEDGIYHESAGGFVFHEDPVTLKLFVALIRPNKEKRLFIPKGHLKKGETPIIAAEREIMEELSLNEKPICISELGKDQYSFSLDSSNDVHHKVVYLYIFRAKTKQDIQPPKDEAIEESMWVEFYDALNKIAYYKDKLLEARQKYYYNKQVSVLHNFNDVGSITVGIPTYNGSSTIVDTLKRAYKSLEFLPDRIEREIIICTDHCTDNTHELVKDFLATRDNSKIKGRLINNNGSQGKVNVLNKIISETKSNLFCVIDDDVELDERCLSNLIAELIKLDNLRCVYAMWVRKKYTGKSLWRKFWHWILGVKFDLPLYNKKSEYMRGACMLFRRENYVVMSGEVINEDQFLQYIYWPRTKEVEGAKIFFNSVTNLTDYYKRFIRILSGSNQLEYEFAEERIYQCRNELHQKINYKNIHESPLKLKLPFYIYRIVRFFIKIIVIIRLKINKKHEWHRINQG